MNLTSNQKSIITPTLWISDAFTARHLNQLFQLAEYKEATGQISLGEHYILAEKDTPEAQIKAVAWRIQAVGGECKVHQISSPMRLEHLAASAMTAQELIVQIIEFARPFDEWSIRNDEQPLTTREAAEIAKVTFALLPEPNRSIELGTLRERCKQSSYDWNKLVGKLEEEFRREVELRLGADNKPNDLDERLRLDLLALLKETDPIKKIRSRAEISSYYRLSKSEVEEMLRHLKKRTGTQETNFYTLDQMLALESEGLQWLIPELLPKGETIILAGSPKAGKTLLAIDAAFAIATGESSFLGEATPRGKVLLVSCDESLSSTKNKLLKRGFRGCDNDYVRILLKWSIDDLDLLESLLEDFRPDVVIIDSLRRITHGSPISENSAEFADNVYTLKETIGRYGASGILIHHTSKDQEAMGVGKIRGSSAIVGAVWGTWQLDHIPQPDPNNKKKLIIDPKDPRRILSVFARDTEGQSLSIEFNPEDNSWLPVDSEQHAEQQTVRQQIISVLTKNCHLPGLSGKEIIELLGMTPEEGRGVYVELNRMANKRLINCKPASGDKRVNLYSLAITQQPLLNLGDSPSPIPCVPIVEYSNESLTTQGLENTQQDTQQLLNNYSTTAFVNTPVEYLESSSGKGFSDTQQPTQKKGGEGVPSVVDLTQYPSQNTHNTNSTPNWKPIRGEQAVYGGELVEIVGFEDRGLKIQIEFKSGVTKVVRCGCLKPCSP